MGFFRLEIFVIGVKFQRTGGAGEGGGCIILRSSLKISYDVLIMEIVIMISA